MQGINKWNYRKVPTYISYLLGLCCFLLALFFHSLVGCLVSPTKTQEQYQNSEEFVKSAQEQREKPEKKYARTGK